jgi:hypothetical protein
MARTGERVVRVSEVRGELVDGADLRDVIGFQNDVNALIGSLARLGTEQEANGLALVQAPFGCLPQPRERPRRSPPVVPVRMRGFVAAR